MYAVDFTDAIKASICDHERGSPWSFLCGLENESNEFIAWDGVEVLLYQSSKSQKHCHMTIMPTHMGMIGLALVLKI